MIQKSASGFNKNWGPRRKNKKTVHYISVAPPSLVPCAKPPLPPPSASITERYRCLCLLSRRVTDKSFMKVYHHCLPPKQMRKSTPRLLQTCWQRLKRWQRKEIGKAKKKIFPIFFRCHVLRFRRAHCCASCFVMRR